MEIMSSVNSAFWKNSVIKSQFYGNSIKYKFGFLEKFS